MGERALRPIGRLRKIVQEITQRGALTADARSSLPQIPLSNTDEVSELAREFHQMATSLIEREKTIEFQKERLEEQNKLLMQMGELQKRLQESEHLAAVGRMSAQVAHEVGNPLHSIGLEAELALEMLTQMKIVESGKISSKISLKQSLQSILESVERLQKIIQNYLRLSKPTSGLKQSVDLYEVMETVLATYSNSFQALKIRVNWNFDKKIKENRILVGDRDLLEYALGNLVKNAIQALDTNEILNEKQIFFEVSQVSSDWVKLTIQDNGPGIPDAIKKNLFKPFMTTKAQGTGLGLSFVKKVFNDAGGEFFLKATTIGQGACFEGTLPLEGKRVE